MKYLLVLLSLFIFKYNTTAKNIKNLPDTVFIYTLPLDRYYIVAVSCNDIQTYDGVSKKTITSKSKIKHMFNLFYNDSNFQLKTTQYKIDSRLAIEFKYKNNVVERFCLSHTKRIEKEGKVYT